MTLGRYMLVVILLAITGCASHSQVSMPNDFWDSAKGSIGIAFVKPPMMDAHRVGGQGLLDYAINEAVTNRVEEHLRALSFDKLENSNSRIQAHIKSRGTNAIVINEYYEANDERLLPKEQRIKGYFDYDLSDIKNEYAINYLLVIQVYAAGTIRDYYGFIPASEPRGYVQAGATMVDLSDNRVVFQEKFSEEVKVGEGLDWDDPENGYPALTAAVEKALENAGTTLIQKM